MLYVTDICPNQSSDMEQLKQQVGQAIQDARKARAMTQEELAGKLGVSRSTVKGYESGKQNLTLETMHKLSVILGIRFTVQQD